MKACRQALQEKPGDLKLMLKLNDHLKAGEQLAEAEAVLTEAAGIHPNNKTIKHELQVVKSLRKEKNFIEKSKATQKKSQASAKKKTKARLNRIRCLKLKGSKGLAACNAAIEILSQDHQLLNARGKILAKMNRTKEAKADFQNALQLDPQNSDYLSNLSKLEPKSIELAATKPANKVKSKKTPPPKPAAPADTVSKGKGGKAAPDDKLIQQMALLKSLYDKGLIDKKEFEKRKSKLLDSTFQVASKNSSAADAKPQRKIDFGTYHALVIGIQNYRHLTPLASAIGDAKAVAGMLQKLYGFKVQTLIDPTRRDILMALGGFRSRLGKNTNLVVYYAGHGWLDEDADAGYWLPVDAAQDNDVDWLALDAVTAAVRAIRAKHVMVVADSCYSGKLTRGVHVKPRSEDYVTRMARKRARVVLSSGGLEPVLDGGGKSGHSVFATAFMEALEENSDIMDGTSLFTHIRRNVMLNAEQTPEYADIRKARHEGGEFLFVRQGNG